MTPCLVFDLEGYVFSTFTSLKTSICFAKIIKVLDAVAPQFHNFELSTLSTNVPPPHTLFPDFRFLMLMPCSSNLGSLRSTLNVC